MIRVEDNYFIIETKSLSYIFHVNKAKYLVHDYFGAFIDVGSDKSFLGLKEAYAKGTSTVLDSSLDPNFSSDNALSEYSFFSKGDYREPAIILKNDERGYTFDFRYYDYEIKNDNFTDLGDLPSLHNVNSELTIRLKEEALDLFIELHYLISDSHDVIARFTKIENNTSSELHILKVASLQLDLINQNYQLLNLNGAWVGEAKKCIQKINPGIYKNDSKTGSSSNKHNPFFMIFSDGANDFYGEGYSFNLMYSSNHEEIIEANAYDHLHITSGINSFLFDYKLKEKESFLSPIGLVSYSNKGLNHLSQNMHDFINDCVVNVNFRYSPRPVLINNWEGTYFKFTERKLINIAKSASKFGIELFVLDDGWFSDRNDDFHGLGDYDVNKKKLPHGLSGLAKKINKLGLKFGLWFEPEGVNPLSKIYKLHPDWAISVNGVKPSTGRNEYLFDLTKDEVCEYIINNISNILDNANIEYIKWDMNRNMSDIAGGKNAGEFYHRYIMGLYHIINTLTKKYPNVLFENCASGGNRFDLGMLSYFPQTWASDNSDPYERLTIQEGYSYGYPISTYSAHVSHKHNHQMLRETSYSSKFAVASFGLLGYELMLNELSKFEKEDIKAQVAFYKEHRELLQFGDFYRLKRKEFDGDSAIWMVISKDKSEAMIGYFNGLQSTTPHETLLKGIGFIDDAKYSVKVFRQDHELKMFGNLINMVLPVHVNCEGPLVRLVSKFKRMEMENEEYVVYGNVLNNGIILKSEWAANGFNSDVRVLGDFGSRLYFIKRIEKGEEK